MKVSLSEQEYRRLEAKNCSFYVGNDVSEHADRFSLLVNSFNNIPFHRLIGLELVAVASKQIIAAITKTEQLYNHRRWSHGGVIASVLTQSVATRQFMKSIFAPRTSN